jgi:outer membrane protein assembly factor BamD
MRARFNFALISLLVAGSLLSGCSTQDEKEKSTEQQLYERAQRALNADNWQTAVSALNLLEENFPFGTFGEQAQLELIYAHYESGDYDLAIATAERFIRLHPQHRHADYAFYLRGLASFTKESSLFSSIIGADNTNRDPAAAMGAFAMLDEFVRKFPSSEYAADAEMRLVFLRNLLARGEINVANYYFSRKAYLAAANRGRYVVENFQGTPAVPDGLATMIQAYQHLGKPELGETALSVLKTNFPNYPALKADGSFDYQYAFKTRGNRLGAWLTLGLFSKSQGEGFDTRDLYHEPASLPKVEAPKTQAPQN